MKEERSTELNRRKMLGGMTAVTGLVFTGGCSEIQSRIWSQTGAGDVILYNKAEDTKTVEVTITGQNEDEAHTERTHEIASGEEINPVNNSNYL